MTSLASNLKTFFPFFDFYNRTEALLDSNASKKKLCKIKSDLHNAEIARRKSFRAQSDAPIYLSVVT